MAERKKVQKIRPKKGVNKKSAYYAKNSSADFKKSKKASAKNKPIKTSRPSYDEIKMLSERETTKRNVKNNPKKSSVSAERSLKRVKKNVTTEKGKSSFNVLIGNKQRNNRKGRLIVLLTAVLIVSVIMFTALSPTGPIEKTVNTLALVGNGTYPITLNEGSIKNLLVNNGRMALLTDTHFSMYNISGKELIEYQHNFNNPVMEIASERSLVYNRESTGFVIANNSDKLYEQELDAPIYCADISNSGVTAFVTSATGYAAKLTVYKRGMKQVFSWSLAEGLISDITLSNNGKYIAIAVLKVKDGSFVSEIICFKTGSKTPVFNIELSNQTVAKLETISGKYFSYVTDKKLAFVKWVDGSVINVNDSELSPSYYKVYSNASLAVFGKNSVSNVVIYDSKGIKTYSFEYNGLIDDIAFYGKNVYILKGNKITTLELDGSIKNIYALEQTASNIVAGKNGVIAADNLKLFIPSD